MRFRFVTSSSCTSRVRSVTRLCAWKVCFLVVFFGFDAVNVVVAWVARAAIDASCDLTAGECEYKAKAVIGGYKTKAVAAA